MPWPDEVTGFTAAARGLSPYVHSNCVVVGAIDHSHIVAGPVSHVDWFVTGFTATALGALIDNRFDQQDKRLDRIELSIQAIDSDRPRVAKLNTKVNGTRAHSRSCCG